MNSEPDPIPVDLTDPESLEEALPLVRKRIDAQKKVVADAKALLEYWSALEAIVLLRLNKNPFTEKTLRPPREVVEELRAERARPAHVGGILDAVVRVVNEAGEPIQPRDIAAILNN